METVVACLYIRNFIANQFLHHLEDQVFVVNVMVIDLTQETVVLNVIS